MKTLETDLSVTERLARLVPREVLVISESGIGSRLDVERLAPHVDAFLVGSALMAASDIGEAARALVHGRVKLCGLTRGEDVALAARSGATHAGFILVPGTPRAIDRQRGRDLTALARSSGLKSVGVFRDADVREMSRLAAEIGLDAVQLHGREDTAAARRAIPPEVEVWALCPVGGTASPARAGADRSLFDTLHEGQCGGTGRPFDWSLLEGRNDLASSFVAGGIGPHNVAQAARIGAYGLDAGSSVEHCPGAKDAAKVSALFAALRPSSRISS